MTSILSMSSQYASTSPTEPKKGRSLIKKWLATTALGALALWAPVTVTSACVVTGTAYAFARLYSYSQTCQTAGDVFQGRAKEEEYRASFRKTTCLMLPTKHCAETEQWRERLIASANHNIVLSGNYCGGDHFLRLLCAIEKRLMEKPELKVIIISSPRFLRAEERRHIETLKKKYSGNFSLIESGNIWYLPGFKRSTNHTKVLTIDFGRYFIQGGSGITPTFADPGLQSASRVEYLGEVDEGDFRAAPAEKSVLGKMLPRAFRDQDFVGKSPIGQSTIGTETYRQALLLAHRWEEFNAQCRGEKNRQIRREELGLFTGNSLEAHPGESLTIHLLRSALPEEMEHPHVPAFRKDSRIAKAKVQLLVQGPKQMQSPYGSVVLEYIRKAKKTIYINHMYFHPNRDIFDALVAAAKRGVKITIISNSLHKTAPFSHRGFVERSRYNYNLLVNSLPESLRGHVTVYEFEQDRMGIHKKAMIIDDVVIAGSSNLGLKSTKWVCDDEFNFVAKSKKLAKETLVIFKEDIQHSRHIKNFHSSYSTLSQAFCQRLAAPLID